MSVMSTPASRAAARDRWNSPAARRIGVVVDWSIAILTTLSILIAGSLNF